MTGNLQENREDGKRMKLAESVVLKSIALNFLSRQNIINVFETTNNVIKKYLK